MSYPISGNKKTARPAEELRGFASWLGPPLRRGL
jgi:hypothetical protein